MRGGKHGYLLHKEEKVNQVQREAEEIFAINVVTDRDASEVNQMTDLLKRRMDKLERELNGQADRSNNDDVVSHLYDLMTTLGDIQDRLDKNVSRLLRDRGMQHGDVKVNMSKPKVFTGAATALEFLEWKKAVERFHAGYRFSEEQQIISYQNELTAGMAKERISQLKSTTAIVKVLTECYGSKRGLVDGFKAELLSIKRPSPEDAAAADYVTAALSKLNHLLRLAREENLVHDLAMLKCEQIILNVMSKHPTLKPFELMFGELYGQANDNSGFVSAEHTFEILLTCLSKADKALLYIMSHDILFFQIPNYILAIFVQ